MLDNEEPPDWAQWSVMIALIELVLNLISRH